MNDITIYISLGDHKFLGINSNDHLVLFSTKNNIMVDYVNLGKLTKGRIEELKGYFDQLAIHAK